MTHQTIEDAPTKTDEGREGRATQTKHAPEAPAKGATVRDILGDEAGAAFVESEKKWKRAARKRARNRRI